MELGWFHRYLRRVRASTLGTQLSSLVDPVPSAKMVCCDVVVKEAIHHVDHLAIQLAKLSGFSPIITTASLKHAEYLKDLGATHVIDRNVSASALASEVNNITQNTPIKYAVDSISLPDTQQAGYELLAPGGQLAVFLPVALKTTKEKDIVRVLGLLREQPNIELLETLYHDNLEELLKGGVLKVSHSYKYPFCLY